MKTPTPKNFQVPGFKAAGIACGLKKDGGKDLALILSTTPAVAAGVFTKNRVLAASVILSRRAVKKAGPFRAIVVNSGNANACIGSQGMKDCKTLINRLAGELSIPEEEILIASTGVIGVPLPPDTLTNGVPELVKKCSAKGFNDAATAIMTTDLTPKTAVARFSLGESNIVIGGIAKGSGMIHPDMATMLGFVQTNARIDYPTLQKALKEANEASFNSITVDGETSTNDTFIVMANGQAGNKPIKQGSKEYAQFTAALTKLSKNLAFQIVKDGEGATKFVTVRVTGAKTKNHAKKIASSVATSSLVKTAIFGEDPNWGRIICAIGYAGVPIRPDRIVIRLNGATLYENDHPTKHASMESLRLKMQKPSILIAIDLRNGNEMAEMYTCDFSYDYVRINAEYTT
ncbi:MAG: bifunctional glutamate N-acetyltransferase/amino-acid acetyltransferase ArgJ [Nitrospinae bacterium]|nr:bifunctional glutamate N-acetyltransferase/amino-acid acetyltransferase ArgJ [Nitrospinota bacterium]